MTSKEQAVRETIEIALVEILKTGNSAPKLYLRVQPDGTVQADEQASWCCSPDEYYKRVPHELSLEVLASTRDYTSLDDDEIEQCAEMAEEAAGEIMRWWKREIAEWIAAGNLVGSAPYVVREFVASHSDDDEIDQAELEHIFRLAMDREPDNEDRKLGLWSLICSEVEA